LLQFNKFFETVNANLASRVYYIGCFERKEQRKKRIFKKMSLLFAYPFYVIDFIWKRVFPKISLTQKLYFALTKGHNRVLPVPEVLGRLISCGFEINDYREINNLTYFTIQKISKPAFDNEPTYGPLITLNRVGKGGKWVKVYKIRTMHSFAEYLQKFVYDQNKLQDGGKFKDDFRITSWGKFLRKFWLDELPMLINWLKGDLKLVGVRPLSQHYFELYPKNFRERRQKYKPGLVPPFYVDLPDTLDEILASEKKYLMQYDKHPFLTDLKYFFKSFYNIIVKKARSK
jgi:lipopolysaccharide/colanic/teichoic acid biosynthesis glycosyltransferase